MNKSRLSTGIIAASVFAAGLAYAQGVANAPPRAAVDAAPMMTIDTATFVKMASGSDQFEIQSSQLAKQKATSPDLKSLADMIIADHTNASQALGALLKGKGKALAPAPPAQKQQRMLDQLKAASGKHFDTLYLDTQAQAHMEAVGLFRTYAGSGDDQEIVGFAKQTLPRLETHLGQVKKLIEAQ